MRRLFAAFPAVLFTLAALIAVSGDCLFAQTNFVKYTGNPVLPLGDPGEWDGIEASHAHVSFDGTTYQMWYSGAPQENTYRIGYATSADGLNWVKDATNPVLDVGDPGTFDSISLWLPTVLSNGTQYEMWYSGGLTISGIGYATSADPVSWVRQSSNPVLVKGGSGAWDENYAYLPVVIRNDTLYQMWYTGRSASGIVQTGYATSTDGMNWSKHPNNPVLSAGDPGEWDSGGASAGSVLFEGGQYHMWYFNWTSTISQIKIGYATSTDGINWTKHPGNPILQSGSSGWDAKNVWFPRVIKDGHRYRMWYTGTPSGTTIDRLGYAEDFSNAAHTESISASPNTMVAGSGEVFFEATIANPHGESLTAKVRVMSNDGSVNELVDLNGEDSDSLWWGVWSVPGEPRDYSARVELKNSTAGYVHNSDDWGVSEEFCVRQATHTFSQIAEIDDDQNGEAQSVTISKDGTIFLANGSDGLRSYFFDGASFSEIAHINDGGSAIDVAEAADGIVFLANGDDGLRAYSYDGSSFASVSHINDGGSAMDIALAPDGTIFLANSGDGLRAYLFDGSSFANTAHIDNGGLASAVALDAEGRIFLANSDNILFAYGYDGASFNKLAQVGTGSYGDNDIVISEDGTVLIANSDGRLRAYNYHDASFILVAHVDTRDWARALAIAEDGTIFLAGRSSPCCSAGNLYAYTFDGTSFIAAAHLKAGLTTAPGSMRTADGTVFLGNGENGLRAYSYSPAMPTSIDETIISPPMKYSLDQNYPNPFNPTTTIEFSLPQSGFVILRVYNLLGQEVATLLEAQKPAGRHTVNFHASALASGLYYYTLAAGDLKQTRKMLLLR